MSATMTRAAMLQICEAAHRAGMTAGEGITPKPMTLRGGRPGDEPKTFVCDEGMCGFAWVTIPNGRGRFARFLRAERIGRKAHPKGVQIWCSEFYQSWERKKAYAGAYTAVLNGHGIEAYAGDALD